MTQEELSVRYVMRFERTEGRKSADVSKRHIGYDIKSGNRYIEVKSRPGSRQRPFLILHKNVLKRLGRHIAHYYIYDVYDMARAPKLLVIPPEVIFSNLEPDVKLLLWQKAYRGLGVTALRKIH